MPVLGVFAFAAAIALAAPASAQDLAPDSLTNTLFHGVVTASTGGLPNTTTFSELFTEDTDFNIALTNSAPSAPAAYTYTKTDADSAVITETGVSVALEFTDMNEGTFVTTFSGAGTQSGTFLIEPLGGATTGGSSLVNLSARTALGAGGVSIGGFVVGGTEPQTVLIRGVGPSLADLGVTDPMPDTVLTVFSGSDVIGTNDNWDSDATAAANLEAAFATTGAFAFDAGSGDAAILLTLEPGAYTVHVSGAVATDSGDVLLEQYLVP